MDMMLETRNLTKKVKEQMILENVSIKVEKGKIYGLLGPNGAGKSTLLKLITKVMHCTSGDILFEGKSMCAEDVLNGVERLESFLKKLNTFSVLMEEPREVVSKEVLDHWIRIATSICKLKGFNLSILGYDVSDIKLDKNAVSVAIQNLVNNAIENSSVDSTIFIGFYDNINDYTIIVRDQGAGFNNEILYDVKGKFVSKKVDDNHVHGLGLSIVTKILDANKGQLLLNNYDDDGNGAEVKMAFKKYE
ncbi:ATP-binding cassette domain-containing protein [Aerococcaceae bacterium zg-B36]|uniref:ATP-binding cassette domain-containing protein n=1 Tax=Aerococcaceae bacterium zg-252 TaxID=2796928 RepID=UPI001BD80891|nr:ATP-binding cassette domain-containing protein [Aerococcaceae bacterium zg-B36]